MATCNRCGAILDPNASFCSKCGTSQAANPGAAPSYVPPFPAAGVGYAPAPVMPAKKGHPVLKVFGIIGAVIVGFAIWGAFLKSSHSGGSACSGSGTYASPLAESRQMCVEIKEHIGKAVDWKIKGVQCVPGIDEGTLGLGIGYPDPVLILDTSARKDALFLAVGAAGWAMSDHPNVQITHIYVMDSTRTAFVVPGSFAKLLYDKVGDKVWSDNEGAEQVAKIARKVKSTEAIH